MKQAIILAGGFGTRLAHLLGGRPKVLAPIAGRPFLDIVLALLSRNGFNRIVLSLGYLADTIIDHVGASFAGMEIVPFVEMNPLGTGGAIKAALPAVGDSDVFVINGDTYVELDYDGMAALHRKSNSQLTMAVHKGGGTSRYGNVLVRNGEIVSFAEKTSKGTGLINAGVYLVSPAIFQGRNLGEQFSFENDFLPRYLTEVRPKAFSVSGYFIDIGVPADYERAQTELITR